MEKLQSTNNKRQFDVAYWLRTGIILLVSSLLLAIAAYCFIAPNKFTVGGMAGIAILINVATNDAVPQSLLMFCINGPLMVVAFFFVKKKFAILSAIHTTLQSAWLLLLENCFTSFRMEFPSGGERIFAAIAAGICVGTAVAMAFKVGGSTGGVDIVATIIQRKVGRTSIAWMMFILNCAVIGSSIFVFQADTPAETLLPIMMSTFELYIESKTNDALTNGFQAAIEFRIITDKPEELASALMQELNRGATCLPATGMYTKEPHAMVVCVVSKRQVAALKRIMKSVDPSSFAVMSNVSQVLGQGFYQSEV